MHVVDLCPFGAHHWRAEGDLIRENEANSDCASNWVGRKRQLWRRFSPNRAFERAPPLERRPKTSDHSGADERSKLGRAHGADSFALIGQSDGPRSDCNFVSHEPDQIGFEWKRERASELQFLCLRPCLAHPQKKGPILIMGAVIFLPPLS